MRKIKVPLEDILIVLEAMMHQGTTDIIIFNYNGVPAIADANEPENIITFATEDHDPTLEEDGGLH